MKKDNLKLWETLLIIISIFYAIVSSIDFDFKSIGIWFLTFIVIMLVTVNRSYRKLLDIVFGILERDRKIIERYEKIKKR